MNLDQVKAVYKALVNDGRARALSAVAKEAGVPKADVERFVAFIKSSPFFKFELTKSGLLSKLMIVTCVPGAYSQVYTPHGRYEFYKYGQRIASYPSGATYAEVEKFHQPFEAEARAAHVPCFTPSTARIDVLGPYLVEWLAATSAGTATA
jgi:hypothetical protein